MELSCLFLVQSILLCRRPSWDTSSLDFRVQRKKTRLIHPLVVLVIHRNSIMADNEQKAMQLMQEAEKKLGSSKGFLSSLFGYGFLVLFLIPPPPSHHLLPHEFYISFGMIIKVAAEFYIYAVQANNIFNFVSFISSSYFWEGGYYYVINYHVSHCE